MDQRPSEINPAKKTWLTRKAYTGPAEKKRDFWRGVGLFFGLNIVMALCSWGASAALANMTYTPNGPNDQLVTVYPVVSFVLGVIPLLINIGLIVFFAFTRSQIALGMLAGFGIALLLSIILGVIFAVACFLTLRSGSF